MPCFTPRACQYSDAIFNAISAAAEPEKSQSEKYTFNLSSVILLINYRYKAIADRYMRCCHTNIM
ncbi:MAG: hypothetical protein ACTS8U_01735 [Arsenophonus sp. ET-DL9-MAG3]